MGKGISLHIGINKLSLSAYVTNGALNSPANDAQAMAAIAKAEGFAITELLLNEKATKNKFLESFDQHMLSLQSGDTFMLTFSGHGGQIHDNNLDEADKKDETWCFYDGHLIDDDLGAKWKEFKKGVRVIVISASCHSRTSLRVYTEDCFGNTSRPPCEKKIEQNGRSILESYLHDPEILASILHISACEDQKEAHDGNNLSLFTGLLVKYWDSGRFQGDYLDLVKRIRSESGYNQRAGIASLGNNDPSFVHSRPFKLLTN